MQHQVLVSSEVTGLLQLKIIARNSIEVINGLFATFFESDGLIREVLCSR